MSTQYTHMDARSTYADYVMPRIDVADEISCSVVHAECAPRIAESHGVVANVFGVHHRAACARFLCIHVCRVCACGFSRREEVVVFVCGYSFILENALSL